MIFEDVNAAPLANNVKSVVGAGQVGRRPPHAR
jgi:hypothetical protein